MGLYTPINGYTKQAIKDQVTREFKGKASSGAYCQYLTTDGKKCAVGMFIPDGHPGQHSVSGAGGLLRQYPDLEDKMPLSRKALLELQNIHDGLPKSLPLADQLNILLEWVDTYVSDNIPQQDVGTL